MQVTLSFYLSCISRTLRETRASYGVNSRVQLMNTIFTAGPFVVITITEVSKRGFAAFASDISSGSLQPLLGFGWFIVVFLVNLIRSPQLLQHDAVAQIKELTQTLVELKLRLEPKLELAGC